MLASAHLFPKFVSDRAAMYHELRKRGTRVARRLYEPNPEILQSAARRTPDRRGDCAPCAAAGHVPQARGS